MPSRLDIDRLHRCVEKINAGEPFARGEGGTTAMLVLLYNDIILGDLNNRYIFVSDTTVSAGCAAWQFRETLHEDGVPVMHASQQLIRFEWGMDVHFMGVDWFCNTNSLRGTKIARAFIDVSVDRQRYFDRDGKFIEAIMTIKHRGGDVL